MDVQQQFRKEESRKGANGETEFKIDGEWIASVDRRPMMRPENENEVRAIETLKRSKVDVALYTVGEFQLDKGEKPAAIPSEDRFRHYQGFTYGTGASLRAKGPAYITQKASDAPRSWEIVDFGRKAWASGEKDYVAEGKDGWVFFAHRVAAPDMSCAKCHGAYRTSDGKVVGRVQNPGDSVGLFVIALRKN